MCSAFNGKSKYQISNTNEVGTLTSSFRLAGVLLVFGFCSLVFASAFPSRAEDPPPAKKRILRIAADPNNLPFCNDRLEGFENKIAGLLAEELNADVQYTWRAQRRGFFRETLKEGDTDLILGVPHEFERALTTEPYYRSTYVFVTRKDRHLSISSFDDSKLRTLRIGVLLIGDDGANTPPAHALASRGIVTNVVGFTIYGDYAQQNPPARIVDAVAANEIDVAIVWGPLAGYAAKNHSVKLELTPVSPAHDGDLRFAFDISIGVRRKNKELRDELNDVLKRKRPELDRILAAYGVPRVELREAKATVQEGQ